MLSDFELITHKFPNRPDIKIYPISDVHLGAAEHMAKEWDEFCLRVKNEQNTYIILGGDLMNNGTRSSVSNVFDEQLRPREQKRIIVERLEPVRDKILCAVTGNHERRSCKDADDDPTYDILCKLDLEHLYRENMAFLRLQFGDCHANSIANPTYVFGIIHGAGGGILTGGSVNRHERFAYVFDGLDALVVGHSHKPFVTQPAKVLVDARNNKVSIKPFKVISMTSWLGYAGYALRKEMLPTSFAPQVIKLQGKHKRMTVEM